MGGINSDDETEPATRAHQWGTHPGPHSTVGHVQPLQWPGMSEIYSDFVTLYNNILLLYYY